MTEDTILVAEAARDTDFSWVSELGFCITIPVGKLPVGLGNLQLVLEIRDGAQAPHCHMDAVLRRIIDQQA